MVESKIRIINPANKIYGMIDDKDRLQFVYVEYDIQTTYLFGLIARGIPNRMRLESGVIEPIVDAKPCWVLTYKLGWFRLEDL